LQLLRILQQVASGSVTRCGTALLLHLLVYFTSNHSIPHGTGDFSLLQSNQRFSRALSPGMKRLKNEAERPLASSTKVKGAWIYTCTPPHVFMAWKLTFSSLAVTLRTISGNIQKF
jgi:hypothetical protein